ncbi:hypothetical protein CTEN210_13552 [Chaetoceros tenuissimus]|uniref:Uncharacterized protein n=1 Tax=Chaetoceros tenuissimus TaxID=426638 RepID=A0AAD3HBC2_9STRA|nr:hypothetical protein CTEN210_13552 [Chaetoceros tenuissimus]
MYSIAQQRSLIIAPIISGSLSMVSSAALLYSIVRSQVKLWRVVRRIIVGFCVFDLFFSFGNALATFMAPKGQALYAIGSIVTCEIQGFLICLGHLGSVFYNASLSIYYAATVRWSMSENDFKRKIEPWCHFISIVQPIIASVFLLAKQSLNFEGKICYISPSPRTCLQSDDIECERGSKLTRSYALWFSAAPSLFVFTIVAINMIIIIVTVIAQKKKSDRWRLRTNDENESFLMRALTCCYNWKEFLRSFNRDSLKSQIGRDLQDIQTDYQNTAMSTLRKSVKTTSKQSIKKSFKKKEVTFSETEKDVTFNESDSSLVNFAKNVITTTDEEKNDEEMILRTASLLATPKAPPSRSGTSEDPYAFNIHRVRKSIRRESQAIEKGAPSTTVNASNKSINIDNSNTNNNDNDGPRIKSNEEEAAIRALLYIASYIVCYLPSAIARFMKFNRNEDEPFYIALLTRIMLPLQGFLFIMVYTRPYVLSLRKSNPEYSRIKAFLMVIQSGGDQDEVVVDMRRRDSRRSLADASPMTDERRQQLQERIRENWRRTSVSIPAATSSAVDV